MWFHQILAFSEALSEIDAGEVSAAQQQWFADAHAAQVAFSTVQDEADWRPAPEGTAHIESLMRAM